MKKRPKAERLCLENMGKLKQSTKNYIYALIANPVTTLILMALMQGGANMLNLIGVGVIGYGIFIYFLFQGIRLDVIAYRARKAAKNKKGKKKKKK